MLFPYLLSIIAIERRGRSRNNKYQKNMKQINKTLTYLSKKIINESR